MLRLILVSLFCLGLLQIDAAARPTHGGLSGPAAPVACPFVVDGGCAGANQNSEGYDPTLFANAQQDGTFTLLPTHPMNFNVPKQDYPVGYDKTLVLKDPEANPPANCSYNNASRPGNVIFCNSANPDTEGYDFTGAISASGQPIQLDYGPNTSGVCTVKNNKFLLNSTNTQSAMHFENGSCSRSYIYNTCTGSGPNSVVNCIQDDSRSASNSAVYEYNDFPNQSIARLISSVGSGGFGLTWLFKYNYVDGLNQNTTTGQHGEIDLYGSQCSASCPITITSKEWSNNFIIWPYMSTQVDNTATFYTSSGSQFGYFVGSTTMNSNVIVTQLTTGGLPNVSAALTRGGWSSLGNFTANNNYINPRGSLYCGLNGATTNWAGDGFAASQTSNVLTITAFPGSGWIGNDIQAGYNVNNTVGSYTQTTIQPFGSGGTTGVGGTGKYLVDGPPQSLSNSRFVLTPGLTSVTSSGNIDLTDGSSINYAGPYLNPTCNK